MGDNSDNNSSVDWGKLGKNILAGAAIVAGACIVFTGLGGALITGLGALGTSIGGMSVGGLAPETAAGLTTLATKAFGVLLAYGGYHFLTKQDNKQVDSAPSQSRESDESFAAREDMRKMQAVMIARMQASGHQPAMALANQPGR